MADFPDKRKIRQVFRNVQKHRQIEQLIRRFSSAKEDIRLAALDRTDLSSCRTVLELGCAFGAFTEALKAGSSGSLYHGIDIIAEYGPFFREALRARRLSGRFLQPASLRSENCRLALRLVLCS